MGLRAIKQLLGYGNILKSNVCCKTVVGFLILFDEYFVVEIIIQSNSHFKFLMN